MFFVTFLQNFTDGRSNSLDENDIKLLAGEVVVARAQNVLMFDPVSDTKKGISGILAVTNFKLTFLTANVHSEVKYDILTL